MKIALTIEIEANRLADLQEFLIGENKSETKPTTKKAVLKKVETEEVVPGEAPSEVPEKEEVKEVQKPKKEKSSPKKTSSVGLTEIQTLIRENVREHRDNIKATLSEYGAAGASDLSEEHYDEFYNFLKAL